MDDYNNAYSATESSTSNDTYLFFGDGDNYAKPLDVAAHEYTHSVIRSMDKLEYENKLGALNESYADIMGALIEGKNENDGLWTQGEDKLNGASRNLANPHLSKKPQPKKLYGEYMNDFCDLDGEHEDHKIDKIGNDCDFGGVHTNSGILNHFAYLIWKNGIKDKEELANLFYSSLYYLTETSDFYSCRGAILATAKDMKMSNIKLEIIRNAFDEVGIINKSTISLSGIGRLTGIVKDSDTNKPIQDVQIIAQSTKGSGISFTDAKGEFSMILGSGTYDLTVKYTKEYEAFTKDFIIKDIVINPWKTTEFPNPILLLKTDNGSQIDDNPINLDFIEPVVPQKTVPNGYKGIYTAQELNNIRNNLSEKYILMNDIDLKDWGNWSPIGIDSKTPFEGIFNGNGYSIKNMTIDIHSNNKNIYAGLFGYVSNNEIRNLAILNSNIKARALYYVGDTYAGNAYAGGIAGHVNSASIINCYTANTSINSSSNYTAYSGGIAGLANSSSLIANCYNTGNVNASSSSSYTADAYAGGVLGNAFSSTITNCYNTGNITASSSKSSDAIAGGITGLFSISTITNCYNMGNIDASSSSGASNVYAGGIAGDSSLFSTSITNCYTIGKITAVSSRLTYVGGLVGYLGYFSSIENSYYINNISNANKGNGTLINVKALSENEMKNKNNYVGFDFDTVWAIDPNINNGYPYFR